MGKKEENYVRSSIISFIELNVFSRNLIARIRSVLPRRREAFAIRLLCQSRRGITSFKDLRTVDGATYNTYTEAAKVIGPFFPQNSVLGPRNHE